MSAEIGVQWRSIVCGSGNELHSRSPSVSALPPLPDLIPIRKTVNTTCTTAVAATILQSGVATTTKTATKISGSIHSQVEVTGPRRNINNNKIDDESIDNLQRHVYALQVSENGSRDQWKDDWDEKICDNDNYVLVEMGPQPEFISDNNYTVLDNNDEYDGDKDHDISYDSVSYNRDNFSGISQSAENKRSGMNARVRKVEEEEEEHQHQRVRGAGVTNTSRLSIKNTMNSSADSEHPNTISDKEHVRGELCQIDGANAKDFDNTSIRETISDDKPNISPKLLVSFKNEHEEDHLSKNCDEQTLEKNEDTQDGRRKTRSRRERFPNYANDIMTMYAANAYALSSFYVPTSRRKKILNKNRKRIKREAGSVTKKTTTTYKKGKTKITPAAKQMVTTGTTAALPSAPSRINPIFLFVKQEDTRIVEVRCEDYDKRNRIRLTKTTNGWKAMPRTDSTTSRSMSLLPKVVVTKVEHTELDKLNSEKNNQWRLNPFAKNNNQKLMKSERSVSEISSHNSDEENGGDTANTANDSDVDSDVLKPLKIRFTSTSTNSDSGNVVQSGHKKHRKKKKKKEKRVATEPNTETTLRRPAIAIATSSDARMNALHENSCQLGAVNASRDRQDEGIEHALPQSNTISHLDAIAAVAAVAYSSVPKKVLPSLHIGANALEMTTESTMTAKMTTPAFTNHAHELNSLDDEHSGITLNSMATNMYVTAASNYIGTTGLPPKEEIATPPVSPYQTYSSLSVSPPALLFPHQLQPQQQQQQEQQEQQPLLLSSVSSLPLPSDFSSCRKNVSDLSPGSVPVLIEPFVAQSEVKCMSACAVNVDNLHSIDINSIAQTSNITSNNIINNNDIHNNLETENSTLNSASRVNLIEIGESKYYDVNKVQIREPHQTQDDELHEYHDLIADIRDMHETHDGDILDHCSENTINGAELLDSLVKRGCEDNNISAEENDLKHTICLSDEYTDGELSLQGQPTIDMMSRLGVDTMHQSSKCLSFNETGEIDGLSLFSTEEKPSNTVETMNNNLVQFCHQTLEEFGLSLEKIRPAGSNVVSPDSCADDLPKDLSFKKSKEGLTLHQHGEQNWPRPVSCDSDSTIQSPQPSGLPAVPPSPDILMPLTLSNNQLSQNSSNHKIQSKKHRSSFPDINDNQLFPTKNMLKRTLQKEPLDLGSKHRKSASPTVSCSEEVNRVALRLNDNEPESRRIKTEQKACNQTTASRRSDGKSSSAAKDPDPLTQLRLLINNPEWKLPDPILVPKDRLNAVLASPAREIPLLLTTRPELRLPEAFAFPSILQDPEILVISFAQLETIIRKQVEFLKADKAKVPTKELPNKTHTQHSLHQRVKEKKTQSKNQSDQQHIRDKSQAATITNMAPVASNLNPTTMDAFNQMMLLPYLNQLGQITPDVFKTMASHNEMDAISNASFVGQNRFMPMKTPPTPNANNSLEFNVWSNAFNQMNNVNLQRMMKFGAEQKAQKNAEASGAKLLQQNSRQESSRCTNSTHATAAFLHEQQQQIMNTLNPITPYFPPNLMGMPNNQCLQNMHQSSQMHSQQQQQMKTAQESVFNYFKEAADNRTPTTSTPFLSNLSSNTVSRNSAAPNTFCQNMNNNVANNHVSPNGHNHPMTQFLPNMNSPATMGKFGTNSSTTNLRKTRKDQLIQHHHAQQQQELTRSQKFDRTKPRVTCKSLINLLQPNIVNDEMNSSLDHQTSCHDPLSISNLMPMSSFDLSSPPAPLSQPKLKVKSGTHLLDPMAVQRRFLSVNNAAVDTNVSDDHPEVGSTTNSIDEIINNNNQDMLR